MDLSKLSRGEQIIAVSGIALFIFSFFKWLGVKTGASGIGEFEGSDSAWGFTLTLIAVLLAIAVTVIVILKATDVKLPDKLGNFSWGQVYLVASAVIFVFILVKVIAGPSIDTGGIDIDFDKTRKIGAFLGLLASAGMVAGGYLAFQESKGVTGTATPPPTA